MLHNQFASMTVCLVIVAISYLIAFGAYYAFKWEKRDDAIRKSGICPMCEGKLEEQGMNQCEACQDFLAW